MMSDERDRSETGPSVMSVMDSSAWIDDWLHLSEL
jgi:hypothetical protein